ncbi:MAG: type II pantothenate kinase [Clostridia bacterium]|nr:type II pantothenate kinase [Clostridia bacterium]
MKTVIGIDVGGSTTKIVGFDENKNLIMPTSVKATDPITSVYGAFGKFTQENELELSDIKRVMITGVGSSFLSKPIYGLECCHVPEFESVGLGGLYLSGLDDAIVVSMGTGTSITHATMKNGNYAFEYLGGTGVGGGTLSGLSKRILGVDSIESTVMLAAEGNIEHVDLRVKDMTQKDIGLSDNITAANFGKLSDLATKGDIALGLINLVFETAGMMSIFAARTHGIKDIVLTGHMTRIPQSTEIFKELSSLFGVNFIIPKNSEFGTVIGTALLDGKRQ